MTTYGRSHLLARAIQSVMRQTIMPFEIIVVMDGPDAQTLAALNDISYSKVRIIALPTRNGAAVSSNVGVANATADWIAFLDDDDEWLPQKLECQLRAACGSRFFYPIACSRILVQGILSCLAADQIHRSR